MPGVAYNKASASDVSGRIYCWEYANEDAPANWQTMACGQAAVCTAMATKRNQLVGDFAQFFNAPWNPDAGWLGAGSTPMRVQGILRSYFNQQIFRVHGIAELKKYLAWNYPVILLLDNAAMGCGHTWGAMHWVTAYGYTQWNVFLSNFSYPGFENDAEAVGRGSNVCPWDKLEKGWNSMVCKALGMGATGLLPY